MLHEILLSLSGHPSPLLAINPLGESHASSLSILSPSEKALLSSISHLSSLHYELLQRTAELSKSHPSSICQAVASDIASTHLAAFQRKVLDVESGILRRDAGSVGAYNIVPLTAIVSEFSEWTRRMEWLMDIVNFMIPKQGSSENKGKTCNGAELINALCDATQTGYSDIETLSVDLVRVAQTAWLRQLSAWVLYGRLPTFGGKDFMIQQEEGDETSMSQGIDNFVIKRGLLPAFVSSATANSILFVGRSLNHIRVRGISSMHGNASTSPELALLPSHLRELSSLSFPITRIDLSRAMSTIRLSLSQNTLQKLLPLEKILEILSLLRDFFLVGRGEFAVALITEADEKLRDRWRRAGQVDSERYSKRADLANVVIKEGEVQAALTRAWATMFSFQGQGDEDDDQLDLARNLIQLSISKLSTATPARPTSASTRGNPPILATTPFRNLLFSVPVTLTLKIPSPLDLFLTPIDLQTYASINAYLLSIRRAHIRLTALWKITALRRLPAPPAPPYSTSKAGQAMAQTIRLRTKDRIEAIRSVWATSSAAIFLLAETEAYFQGEVVHGLWDGFKKWVTGPEQPTTSSADDAADLWAFEASPVPPPLTSTRPSLDPQTLADAHTAYLKALSRHLLLTTPLFTDVLYALFQHIDQLAALMGRLHNLWAALDLETDQGVVDAFVDLRKEEVDVKGQLDTAASCVKDGIEKAVGVLRGIDGTNNGEYSDWNLGGSVEYMHDGPYVDAGDGGYVPAKVGRVDRLLMKLDFGGWFDEKEQHGDADPTPDLGHV